MKEPLNLALAQKNHPQLWWWDVHFVVLVSTTTMKPPYVLIALHKV